ncbi:MAG TPA: DUF2147 domain-containing protein [Bacteroidales bacterium]|mgnify:CR=1 FL=1|nr:DUF2147 domain-containing protein [Bacteroidales bacterium]HPS63024.1 DUF2147 domain-containing protein [Bacteroidales bacterium]
MKKNATVLFLAILLAAGSALTASAQGHKADDILGTWLNQEATGKVTLFKEGGKYFGKLVWLREPLDKVTGKPRTDKENPDEKLKSTPLIGIVNMKNFTFDGKEEWSGGTIYDPKNGKTFKCYIQFESPNKLKIRGYIGVSVLGRNTYWTRTTPPQN